MACDGYEHGSKVRLVAPLKIPIGEQGNTIEYLEVNIPHGDNGEQGTVMEINAENHQLMVYFERLGIIFFRVDAHCFEPVNPDIGQ